MTDLVGMYLQAITFLDCACLCNETSGLEKGSARSIYLGTPVIVNCAFACEIFLKLLLEFNNVKYKKQHGLKELFDLFPEEYYNLQIDQTFLFVFCEILKKESEERLGWKGYDGREK